MTTEFYTGVMLIIPLTFFILAGVVNYYGGKLQAAEIFANGAFLYAFFAWIEFRISRKKELHND